MREECTCQKEKATIPAYTEVYEIILDVLLE